MANLYSFASLNQFFQELYGILRDTDNKATEVWFEISEISFLRNLDKYKLTEFLLSFSFIEIKKGNHNVDYISIDKILFVIESIKVLNLDIKLLAELLDYTGFEMLINKILSKNNYRVLNNFRFSDKSQYKNKTSQKRYEVDVIGLNLNILLLIDAKQWRHKDVYSSMNKAANLQYQRAIALKKNPDAFSKLIRSLLGINPCLKNCLPFSLIPIMVTLEDNFSKLNDIRVPLVSINHLNTFLQELYKYSQYYKIIKIKSVNTQKKLM
ncbi:MAG: hypothetical protein ACFFDK_04435 [Promethearchaeota archaeon]